MRMSALSVVILFTALASAAPGVIPIISDYSQLMQLCENGGPNAYVGVRYQGNNYKTFNYGECYPYEIDGNLAEQGVFCKSATCYNNPNPDCTGGTVLLGPVPFPAGATLANVADFVQLLGQGATCQPNDLP